MEKQLNFNYNRFVVIKKGLNSKGGNSPTFKSEKNTHLKLIKTRRGKYHSGTWLHAKLIIEFIRRLDVRLAVSMDLFIQDLIIHSNEIKIERQNTIARFHPLTDVIKTHYIPKQESDNAKKFAYSSLMTLINLQVLGMSAKKYCKLNGITVDTSKNISVRDYLPKKKLDEIKTLEQHMHGLILYAGITDYHELKDKLSEF